MNYVPKFEDVSQAAKSIVRHREKVTAEREAARENQSAAVSTADKAIAAQRLLETNVPQRTNSAAAQRVLDNVAAK